jgi:APA family basic amino acid/polyamine antiporter
MQGQLSAMKNSLNNSTLKREIGFFSATTLVVANMVGTGIFTTSGFIIKELANPMTMLLCWLVGGLFALCGALCYGELGARFPHAGGEYIYLREAFGKLIAFLSGWISLIVGFSAPIAAAAVAFATYFFRAFSMPVEPQVLIPFLGINFITLSPVTFTAIAVVIFLSLLHYHSLKIGSRVQNLLTLLKVSVIVVFIGLGLFSSNGSAANFGQGIDFGIIFQDKFAIGLIFISFAYSGWNAAAYLGGEIKNPEKNIPLSLFTGTFLVIGLYLLLNLVYIYALPVSQMSGTLDVGAKAAAALFGKQVGHYFSGAIAIGLLSVLSAMIMAGPRVYYAMSKDGVFFKRFAKVSKSHHTPAYSIFLQAAIAVVMILTASYNKLLIYIGFTLSLFAMLTVIGLMKFRIKRPSSETYQTWGYPLTPLLFILGNMWIIYFSVRSRPVPALAGLFTIVCGIGVYYFFNWKKKHKEGILELS